VSEPAIVYGAGAACPLGLTPPTIFAAVNAGIRRFIEIESVMDAAGKPAHGCRLSSLEIEDPFERATWFARHAIADALRPLTTRPGVAIPIFVAGPTGSRAAPRSESLGRVLREATPEHLELSWGPDSIIAEGRAGGAAALEAAFVALGSVPFVLIGGIDCQVAGSALHDLAQRNRLLGNRNCDGRLPGEGAAFVLLGRRGMLPADAGLGLIHTVVRSRDPRPFDGELANQALGLSDVFARLRLNWSSRVDEIVAAQSTERYWGTELATAYLRNAELMPEPMLVRQLGNALGDCGAAAFPLGLTWALDDLAPRAWRECSARSALVYSSSDAGFVGAALISAPPPGRQRSS